MDYSSRLTPDRLAAEEAAWGDPAHRTWPVFAAAIERLRRRHGITSIVEFGCGTGWVAAAMAPGVYYLGVDANPECIALARRKSPERAFWLGDVRAVGSAVDPLWDDGAGLACAFSFFKHFGLHEWDAIVRAVLQRGRRGLFSTPVGPESKDDGAEFPHVWVDEPRLRQATHAAGHEIVELGRLPWGETLVETCRR